MWTELTFETLLKFEKVCVFFCSIGKGRDLMAWRKCNSCQECSDLVLQSTLTSCSVMACAPARNLAWHHLKLLVKLLLSQPPAPPQSADKHQSLQSFIFCVTRKPSATKMQASDSVLQMSGLQKHHHPHACSVSPINTVLNALSLQDCFLGWSCPHKPDLLNHIKLCKCS